MPNEKVVRVHWATSILIYGGKAMRRKTLVIAVLVVFFSTLPMWVMAMSGGGGMGGSSGMGVGRGMSGGWGNAGDEASNSFSDHHGSGSQRGSGAHHDGTQAGGAVHHEDTTGNAMGTDDHHGDVNQP